MDDEKEILECPTNEGTNISRSGNVSSGSKPKVRSLDSFHERIEVARLIGRGLLNTLLPSGREVSIFLASIKKTETMANDRIMLNFSPLERKNFYPLTHYSKDLFNNALLLIRALYNLPKYNKNTSWKSFWDIYDKLLDMLTPLKKIKDSEEKREVIKRLTNIREKIRLGKGYGTKIQIKSLQGDLFYLLKYLKSYKSIGHAKVAQETLKAVNQSWLSTTTLMRDWLISKKNKEKNLGKKPRLPYYLLKNGEFLVRYNRQTSVDLKTFRKHLQNTARIRIKKKGRRLSV